MSKEIDPTITEFLSKIGKRGGRSRAKKYSHKELSTWAKQGGRPTVLTDAKLKKVQLLRKQGFTLEAISEKLDISIATTQRAVKKLEGGGL